MNLEQYLKTNCERQVIDHAIRAEIGKDGCPRFYIHPAGVSGETLDFVVTKNQLHPVEIWDGIQLLASDNPIPPDIRAKMDADREPDAMELCPVCHGTNEGTDGPPCPKCDEH